MPATAIARRDITVQDLYLMVQSTDVYVLSGFNGKMLAKPYKASKHYETIGQRIVTAVWADLKVSKAVFGSSCKPVIYVYVYGDVEHDARVKEVDNDI